MQIQTRGQNPVSKEVGKIMVDLITSKTLAKIVGKSPDTVRKYAPDIPGAGKHGNTWIFTDLVAAEKWFKDRLPQGRPPGDHFKDS